MFLFGAGVGCEAKAWGKDLEGSGLYNKAYYTRIKGLGCSRTIFQMASKSTMWRPDQGSE